MSLPAIFGRSKPEEVSIKGVKAKLSQACVKLQGLVVGKFKLIVREAFLSSDFLI
ncbi:hypothetical protein H6G04_26045 [Calothrix membranacea FACHB-236]|nr:hypothetical protein [Calothrix membranacea FACHB-236]